MIPSLLLIAVVGANPNCLICVIDGFPFGPPIPGATLKFTSLDRSQKVAEDAVTDSKGEVFIAFPTNHTKIRVHVFKEGVINVEREIKFEPKQYIAVDARRAQLPSMPGAVYATQVYGQCAEPVMFYQYQQYQQYQPTVYCVPCR